MGNFDLLTLLPRRAWRLIPQMVHLLKSLWSRVVGSPFMDGRWLRIFAKKVVVEEDKKSW